MQNMQHRQSIRDREQRMLAAGAYSIKKATKSSAVVSEDEEVKSADENEKDGDKR